MDVEIARERFPVVSADLPGHERFAAANLVGEDVDGFIKVEHLWPVSIGSVAAMVGKDLALQTNDDAGQESLGVEGVVLCGRAVFEESCE